MAMNSTRRKLAIATWSAPREGNIYGKLTVNAEPALAYLAALTEATGENVTLTHFVGKAVATALASSPGLNGASNKSEAFAGGYSGASGAATWTDVADVRLSAVASAAAEWT